MRKKKPVPKKKKKSKKKQARKPKPTRKKKQTRKKPAARKGKVVSGGVNILDLGEGDVSTGEVMDDDFPPELGGEQ